MKNRLAVGLLASCLASSATFAAAPASVADSLLSWVNDRLGPVAPTQSALILLRSDGTYQEISIHEFSITNISQPVSSGTYSYVVSNSDPNQATLTLGANVHPLVFQDSASGTVTTFIGWTFRLSPAIATSGAVNVSNRAWVSPAKTAITGFVVGGSVERWVLLRAAGPALVPLGVPVVVANPQLKLFKGQNDRGTFGSWSADANLVPGLNTVFTLTGAFPFATGSADSAALVKLEPGNYTMHCLGATSEAEVLMEVYVLPHGG